MDKMREAKFKIGQVVKHRVHPFRGVIFDIDPVFNNTEEWLQSIPADSGLCVLVLRGPPGVYSAR